MILQEITEDLTNTVDSNRNNILSISRNSLLRTSLSNKHLSKINCNRKIVHGLSPSLNRSKSPVFQQAAADDPVEVMHPVVIMSHLLRLPDIIIILLLIKSISQVMDELMRMWKHRQLLFVSGDLQDYSGEINKNDPSKGKNKNHHPNFRVNQNGLLEHSEIGPLCYKTKG